MKRTTTIAAIGLLVLLTLGRPLAAQQPAAQSPAPDRARTLEAAREIMAKSVFCAFITIGEDGQPQARTVQPFAPDAGMVVWIGTNPLTRKIAEIEKEPRVALYYYADMGYVTLIGRAARVEDSAEKQRHWNDAWAGLYKDKFRGDDFTLIRVAPVRLEIVDQQNGIVGDPRTWKPVSIEFK